MIRTQDLDPKDYKYIIKTPDKQFSPQRNNAIIAETIKEAEIFHAKFANAINQELYNRMDMITSYGRYVFNRGYKSLEEYLGRELHYSLISEKIRRKVEVMKTVNRLQGNDKYKNFVQITN